MEMKAKILIGVICFIVGAGAYYLYENNFSHSSKVEKCSDNRFYDEYRHHRADDKAFQDGVKWFLKKSYTYKIGDINYRNHAEYCEDYAKKYPDIFKKQY